MATNGLRPVRRLTGCRRARSRAPTTSQPIEVTGDDELARLTAAFNTMLASLAASRQRQTQLVADAGHELRTPLTSLRTNLELLAQADRPGGLPPDARAELLADVRAQIDELSTLVGDLVELARDEPMPRNPEPVDLAEVVEAAAARVRRRAPGGVPDRRRRRAVAGDRRAGAAASAPSPTCSTTRSSGAHRAASSTCGSSGGRLTVRDHGPGIDGRRTCRTSSTASTARPRRAPCPAPASGLAIVRRTADRHGGTTAAANAADGGAVLTLSAAGPSHLTRGPVPPADRSAGGVVDSGCGSAASQEADRRLGA